MSNLNNVYNVLPPWAQNVSCTAYGIFKNRERQGTEFYNFYYSLLKSEFDSAETIRKKQQDSLQEVIRNASINNPYYRETFRNINLDPNSTRYIARVIGDINWSSAESVKFFENLLYKYKL